MPPKGENKPKGLRNMKKRLKAIRLVIFDLDGTLVDAHEAIIRSVNYTLGRLGLLQQRPGIILKSVGWGDRKLIGDFISGDIDMALAIYRRHHKKSLKKYARLLPFTTEILSFLKSRGFKLAIASNRPAVTTRVILNNLKIAKYFDYSLCADKLPRGKPDPEILLRILKALRVEKDEALYVGDMVIDIQAGHRAGIRVIVVRGGLAVLKEIKKARPFMILKNLADLIPAVKRCLDS